jgi:hypothetical protein
MIYVQVQGHETRLVRKLGQRKEKRLPSVVREPLLQAITNSQHDMFICRHIHLMERSDIKM